MPAVSKRQANLMRAAEHGAKFPMAKKVRASMTHGQMREFAKTKETKLPAHVSRRKTTAHPQSSTPNRYGSLARHGR